MEITPYQEDVYSGSICPYCKCGTKIITEEEVYGKVYNKKRKIIACKNFPYCKSYVGTDDKGVSLGRLANAKLRKFKREAHKHFDPLWKDGYLKRKEAYKELSEFLDIPPKYTHIGMFNINTCKKVIDWAKNKLIDFKSYGNTFH